MKTSSNIKLLTMFFFLTGIVLHSYSQEKGVHRNFVNVQDFGAVPNDKIDDTESLRAAVKAVCSQKGATLFFPPGRYLLSDPKALQIQEDALYGKLGKNPQDQLFVPNRDYVIGLDFNSAKNLTIDAKNVELLCDGWMEPLSFRFCENITLNGISIDYKRPANSEGTIIKTGKNYVDVVFPETYPVSEDLIMLRIMIYDVKNRRLAGSAVNYSKKKFIAPQTVRFYGKEIVKLARPGDILMVWSGFHYRPAILIYKTRDITLNDVSIHSQAGMGIVGHLSGNITMNRLHIVPKEGRHISTNTDATHFATNRGFIRFNDCRFEGQGDDATNVHTYYYKILESPDESTCVMAIGRETHSSYLDEVQTGDELAIVDRKTLKEAGKIKVKNFLNDSQDQKIKIEFEGRLPKNHQAFFLINTTTSPRLYFTNCEVKSHRARSVLVKTRKVLIENCRFENTTGTAIHIGAEGDWSEGPASRDVIVRNNRFMNCGIGGIGDGTLDGASAIAIHIKAKNRNIPGLHKRILIEGNQIIGGIHAITVKGASDVLIQNNTFTDILEEPILIGASEHVKVISNTGAENIGTDQKIALPNIN